MLDSVEAALISNRPAIQGQGDSGKAQAAKQQWQKDKLLESWRGARDFMSPVIDPSLVHSRTSDGRHPPECDLTTPLKTALDQLIESLSGTPIAVSNKNRSGFVWGRVSVLSKIAEFLGPVMDQVIPEGSLAWTTLQEAGSPFPFAKQVSVVGKLPKFTRNMILARDALDFCLASGRDDVLKIRRQGEFLNTAAAILEAVSRAFDSQTYHWCCICFRRTVNDRRYCREHKRSDKTGPGLLLKGRRVRDALSNQTARLFDLYRSRRRALGENVQLLSAPTSIPRQMQSDWRAITVHPMIEALAESKVVLQWPDEAEGWDKLFESMPLLSQRLQQRPSDFKSWEQFSKALMSKISDTKENTAHPYWVLQVAILAERWVEAEQKTSDRRTTARSVEIIKLLKAGMKQTDIAKRLEVTKAAVSKANKKLKAR